MLKWMTEVPPEPQHRTRTQPVLVSGNYTFALAVVTRGSLKGSTQIGVAR